MNMKTTKKNQAIGEIYSYEGDSEIVRVTIQLPTKELAKLSPIKQGDLFAIQNLSNENE